MRIEVNSPRAVVTFLMEWREYGVSGSSGEGVGGQKVSGVFKLRRDTMAARASRSSLTAAARPRVRWRGWRGAAGGKDA